MVAVSSRPNEKGGRTIGPAIQHGEAISPRILLIDDEQRILNFVSRGLRRDGFAVDVAAEGSEGLRLATSESYDLVILDLLMPGLDGKAVLRGIMAQKPQQPVMVLSAGYCSVYARVKAGSTTLNSLGSTSSAPSPRFAV